MKKYLSKKYIEKYIQVITCLVISVIFSLLIEYKGSESSYIVDRIFILSGFFSLIGFHFIFDKRMLWNFIFKKRWIIIGLLFFISVLCKYNLTSIEEWNKFVDPSYKYSEAIFGESRAIRSDEWLVSLPTILSQEHNMSSYNESTELLRGTKTTVNLYPKLPTTDISVIGDISYLGFLFLPQEYAFSFMSMFEFFALFMITFEFLYILTKNNKLISLLGAIMIAFSPAIMWWSGNPTILYGQAAIVLLYYFLQTKSILKKILLTLGFSIVGLNYIFVLYPAWQLVFGYLFAAIGIYFIIIYRKNLKKADFLYLIGAIVLICSVFIPVLLENIETFKITSNTVYPGNRIPETGTYGSFLFNYSSSLFYSFAPIVNPSEYSQFISLYPLPIIIAIGYLIKEFIGKRNNKIKKVNKLLLILCVFSIVLSIWNFISIPEIITKITLLSYTTTKRTQLAVSYATVIILLLVFANYQKDKRINVKEMFLSLIGAASFSIISLYLVNSLDPIISDYLTIKLNIAAFIIITTIAFALIYNNKLINKYIIFILISLSLLIGLTIVPLVKGIDVFYEKPTAKEIRKIVENNRTANWLAIDSILLQQYLVANGAKTINSVNYFPNLELWEKLDDSEEAEQIYNRYSHIEVNLIASKTNFELIRADYIRLNLNYDDICKVDADYILSTNKISYSSFEEIANGENTFIYKTKCNN